MQTAILSAVAPRASLPQRAEAASKAETITKVEAATPEVRSVTAKLLATPRIAYCRSHPRVMFDSEKLISLAQSIRDNGLLQPLTVMRTAEGGYRLISGARRLRACELAGIKIVPCFVLECAETSAAVVSLLDNLQRVNLNYIEVAYSLRNLIRNYGYTVDTLADKLSLTSAELSAKLSLLSLTEEEKSACLCLRLTERQAREVLRIPEGATRRAVIEDIAALGLSEAGTAAYVTEYTRRKLGGKPTPAYEHCLAVFNKAMDTMRRAGIDCVAGRTARDGYVEYVLRVPARGSVTVGS